MKQTIIVILLTSGTSLLLTALGVWISPDLATSPGGVIAVFSAVFLTIMGLGGGTIKGWVETFWREKEKDHSEVKKKDSLVIAHVENFYNQTASDKGVNNSEEKLVETREIFLSSSEAQSSYLSALIDDFRPLNLAGMGTYSGDTKARLPLEDIYISLNTTTQVEKEFGLDLGREENRPLTALEAFLKASEHKMILLGAPGTGKSTFVRYLSLKMAKQLLNLSDESLENWTQRPLLPIAISLGRFAEFLALSTKTGTSKMMEEFIVATLEADNRMKIGRAHV